MGCHNGFCNKSQYPEVPAIEPTEYTLAKKENTKDSVRSSITESLEAIELSLFAQKDDSLQDIADDTNRVQPHEIASCSGNGCCSSDRSEITKRRDNAREMEQNSETDQNKHLEDSHDCADGQDNTCSIWKNPSYTTEEAEAPDVILPAPAGSNEKCCATGKCQSSAATEIAAATSGARSSTNSTHEDMESMDIEHGLQKPEHVIVRIRGMDCTGCDKKVYKALQPLPGLSNIKASFLLAQVEFDIRPSTGLSSTTIISILEKRTGFTCSRIAHIGSELELDVKNDAQQYTEGYPNGVLDILVIGKSRLQVLYDPAVVGARDLLANEFFRGAELAPLSGSPTVTSGRQDLYSWLRRTLVAAVLTVPVLVLTWAPLPKHPITYGAICLALATIVQFYPAAQFYSRAFKALVFSREIDMDLLVVLSSSTAYLYSVVAYTFLVLGRPLQTEQFFETSTLLITLILLGRTISTLAKQKAIESISIESLQASTAILCNIQGGGDNEIDARLLQYGDIFKVLPDLVIPTDGLVSSGESEVDESMITGEGTLITKTPGTTVAAGTINHSGILIVKLTRLPCENTIKEIGDMVDRAKASKPRVQDLADRLASYFVPVILTITVLVFTIWIGVGMKIRRQNAPAACINAMTYAISVLIVSCPCAIGLAVPMVLIIAGGVAAKHGLIFKDAEAVDTGRKIAHVIFDKTGTLTRGKLSVASEDYLANDAASLKPVILGLTSNSTHPVSKAIAIHLTSRQHKAFIVQDMVSVAGKGIEANWNRSKVRAGNPFWLGVQDTAPVQKALALGLTIFCITLDKELVAVYGLEDSLRPDALATVMELKRRSIAISIVSGDNHAAVQSVATQLAIPSTHIRPCFSPEQKQRYVVSLIDSASHQGLDQSRISKNIVLFVGDGTNDAPPLAAASIGLHISEGTEVASSAADAVLMRPSLHGIITLIDLSKAFHRRVVFNFAWSFAYNFFAVLLAAGVFSAKKNVRIPPQYAGLGEMVSVVPVVVAAMGLQYRQGQV